MGAMMDRKQARERLEQVLAGLLDRYIPTDEEVPLRGRTFREWEDQADEFDQQITGAFLETLAHLDEAAVPDEMGCCPHCGSGQVRTIKASDQMEIQTKHGPVVLPRTFCRCRSCGRSFFPSESRLGSGDRGEVVTEGGRTGGT